MLIFKKLKFSKTADLLKLSLSLKFHSGFVRTQVAIFGAESERGTPVSNPIIQICVCLSLKQ